MNAGISRCWRYSRSITMPSVRALAIASSTSPPVPASPESKTQQRRLVGAEVGVREHLVGGGLLEVERGRQLVVLHLDELGGVARLGGACGRRRRRRSRRRRRPGRPASASAPGVTWSGVIGQALMQAPSSSPKSAPVSTSTTLVDGLGRGGVDAGDGGVRERAAHHREVQHPGQHDVVGPAGAAGDQPLVLLAAPVAADLLLDRVGGALLGGGHAVHLACPAACCTALTMLW